jgi:hypothetical protein
MPIPWLRLFDLLLSLLDLRRARLRKGSARVRKRRRRGFRHIEARLAGAMAAALDDVSERDRRREALERERQEEARREAERAARLDGIRHAGDREIGRLRLVAGLALVGWVGSLFVVAMLSGTGAGPRVLVATGWVLLLVALTSALYAQSGLGAALARFTDPDRRPPDSGVAGIAAAWLLLFGLALVAIAALTI